MQASGYHLAQVNIARMVAPLDHPVMGGFVSALDRINALAERSPGFVWRLQTDDGDATALRVFDDPSLLINLSVWSSVEALYAYTYRSAHRTLLRGRKQWFTPPDGPHLALWWIPAGTLPTPAEARTRLARLRDAGPTAGAFTFKHRYPAPDDASA